MQLKCIQCGHVLNASLVDQCPNCHKLWYHPYPCANDTTNDDINDDALFTAFLAMTTSDSPSYDYDSSSNSSSSCDSSSD